LHRRETYTMDSSSQISVLRKDVQELEQMNGTLLDKVAKLERELMHAQSRASEAESRNDVLCAERDELRKKLLIASTETTAVEPKGIPQQDLRSALLEIERFESLLRIEKEARSQLEGQLALRQKLDVETGLSHQLAVSELERMNAMLAADNASLQETINKTQLAPLQPSSLYKPELSMEPCAEPEQDENNSNRDSLTQWYLTK